MGSVLILCAAVGGAAGPPALGRAATPDRVAGLVRQLGSEWYRDRATATAALSALGERAVPALRRAASAHDDPEVRMRAGLLLHAAAGRAARQQYADLLGDWKVVTEEQDGKKTGGDVGMVVRISPGRLEVVRGPSNGEWFDLRLGPPASAPRPMDLVREGMSAIGVYEVDRDTLRFCYTLTADPKARPVRCETKPNSGLSMLVLRRAN